MSGRAGRRGQDLLGDVYFFDIPLPKIEKLIKSNVPQLRGQFPLSISLVLRLMLLASKGDDPGDAQAKVCAASSEAVALFLVGPFSYVCGHSFSEPPVLSMPGNVLA